MQAFFLGAPEHKADTFAETSNDLPRLLRLLIISHKQTDKLIEAP